MSCLVQLPFVEERPEVFAVIAEEKDVQHQVFELFSKCTLPGFYEDSTSRLKFAEPSHYQASAPSCTSAACSSWTIAMYSCQSA
jgi:hypothetical protein